MLKNHLNPNTEEPFPESDYLGYDFVLDSLSDFVSHQVDPVNNLAFAEPNLPKEAVSDLLLQTEYQDPQSSFMNEPVFVNDEVNSNLHHIDMYDPHGSSDMLENYSQDVTPSNGHSLRPSPTEYEMANVFNNLNYSNFRYQPNMGNYQQPVDHIYLNHLDDEQNGFLIEKEAGLEPGTIILYDHHLRARKIGEMYINPDAYLNARAVHKAVKLTIFQEWECCKSPSPESEEENDQTPKRRRQDEEEDLEWKPKSVFCAYTNVKVSDTKLLKSVPPTSCFGKINMRVQRAWARGPNKKTRLSK